MLPKFSGDGDAYIFLSEFEKVYSMVEFPNVSEDAVTLRFIPLALKDLAKKWNSFQANFISSWDGFVRIFLRKCFLNEKIVKLRKINHFVQLNKESF